MIIRQGLHTPTSLHKDTPGVARIAHNQLAIVNNRHDRCAAVCQVQLLTQGGERVIHTPIRLADGLHHVFGRHSCLVLSSVPSIPIALAPLRTTTTNTAFTAVTSHRKGKFYHSRKQVLTAVVRRTRTAMSIIHAIERGVVQHPLTATLLSITRQATMSNILAILLVRPASLLSPIRYRIVDFIHIHMHFPVRPTPGEVQLLIAAYSA
mmetsp:Transcript_28693/g.53389  ORF Transcript_28693/g.53389 Transcript_28693/m.53389 type:complete len:208 (+) Transcript_28693:763-1386(+)